MSTTTQAVLRASRLPSSADNNFGWDLFVTYGPDGVPTFTSRVFSGVGLTETKAAVEVRSPTTPPDGAWHHVVMTYDGGGADGVGTLAIHVRLGVEDLLYTNTVTPAPYAPNPSAALRIGARTFVGPEKHFHGDLDEAAFYNVALPADVIAEHHRAVQP